MTALIVEDGSIVTNANTYISATDFSTFATSLGITLVSDPESLLLQAMIYIESLNYKGVKYLPNQSYLTYPLPQSLQWPRWGVKILDFWIPVNAIPQQLKDGQCWAAILIDQGVSDPLKAVEQTIIAEKLDLASTTYGRGSSSKPINITLKLVLQKLLKNPGFGQMYVSPDGGEQFYNGYNDYGGAGWIY